MSEIALTDIRHGLDDGTVIEVKQGNKIPSTIPGSALLALRDAGAVGEAPVTKEEISSKDARIAELEKALAEAQAKAQTGTTDGSGDKTPADAPKTPAK